MCPDPTAKSGNGSGPDKKRSSMLEQAEGERSSLEHPQCRQRTPSTQNPVPSMKILVAKMSHDLRTPLAAILANAEFLASSNPSKIERDDLYEEIRLSINRMSELISDLLDCSKSGEALRPSIGNIVETMQRIVKMIAIRPAFRRIKITHRHEGPAQGWYNSDLLERALANIVLNACEAVSPDSGRVEIMTQGGVACLRIEVWDNGPGISPDIQKLVFQPFFTFGKPGGTGLGLAIAKRIIEDHDGEIYLDTKRTGTSFKISIPFAIPREATA
jgi:signal transduction histidine kinase